uniref:G-protein coupled receptors family 2 profile 2 domain-containing protein n=1 Tax=Oryzias sinensis TaxID=183150 RepID=A0A8C7YEL6_9TELE
MLWVADSKQAVLLQFVLLFLRLTDMALLGIGFALGYGAPLIIASITIASTAGPKKYIQGCWLQWDDSKALLAFVIPVLVIILINFIILIVVLHKIFRSRAQSAQSGDKHILFIIAKSVAVLTPVFGLTWGLGIGLLVDPKNKGIHYSFAFFNSLQGFFILVFGTLLDKRVGIPNNVNSKIFIVELTCSTIKQNLNMSAFHKLSDVIKRSHEILQPTAKLLNFVTTLQPMKLDLNKL